MGRLGQTVYALPVFEVGDRIAWNPSHISQSISDRTQGEIVRVDYIKGVVAQYVVFNDYADYVKVSGTEGRHIRGIPLRTTIPRENMDLGPGSVIIHCGEEVIVSEILPNNFLLLEPPRLIPIEREYAKLAPGKRRHKNFKVWDKENHPYTLKVPLARIDPRTRKKNPVDKALVLAKRILLDLQGYGPFDCVII